MRIIKIIIFVIALAAVLTISIQGFYRKSDEEIREILVKESINNYLTRIDECPCPFSTHKTGEPCEGKNAWSQKKDAPFCYLQDVTKDAILNYRKSH